MKKRTAIRTTRPFQACVLAFGEKFIFSNGFLMYKTKIDEIRFLMLNQRSEAELHVDTGRLLMESQRLFGCELDHEAIVEPVHCAFGIASFIVEEGIGDSRRVSCILVTDLYQRAVIQKCDLDNGRCVFVRNTQGFLCVGERSAVLLEAPQWRLHMLNLSTLKWETPRVLPRSFAGRSIDQNVCFETINGFLYGVQSATDNTGHAVHYVVRLSADGGTLFDYGYMKMGQETNHCDKRFSELKICRDELSGQVWVYEIRKQFLSAGYSERLCHAYPVQFADVPPTHNDSSDIEFQPLELLGAGESHRTHRVGCGLDIHGSDPRLLLAHTYDTSTSTFLDMLKEPSTPGEKMTKAYLMSRSKSVDKTWPWGSSVHCPRPTSPAHAWPATAGRGKHLRTLQALMNPTNMAIHYTRWYFWNGLLIFSPANRDGNRMGPIILLSFDPALRVPGLKATNSQGNKERVEHLSQLPERPDTGGPSWISEVKPYHMIIRSLEADGHRTYGLDFGYNKMDDYGT